MIIFRRVILCFLFGLLCMAVKAQEQRERTISGNVIGKVLKEIGKESFVIMAFHLIAFKALTLILFIFGIDERLGLTYPNVGDSSLLLLLYTIIGIFLPLLFVKMVRYIPSTIRQIIKSKC